MPTCADRIDAVTVTIELPPELEAGLRAQAKARGLPLTQYLQRVLLEAPARTAAGLSPTERAAAWRDAAKGLPHTPVLSDEVISRETLYAARGLPESVS
jgi:hypothetical protein